LGYNCFQRKEKEIMLKPSDLIIFAIVISLAWWEIQTFAVYPFKQPFELGVVAAILVYAALWYLGVGMWNTKRRNQRRALRQQKILLAKASVR
jgi:type VI protein secretion system component VasK